MVCDPNTKNLRHGRLTIKSGDGTPLSRVVAFAEGDLEWTITRNVTQIKDRGVLDHLRAGDQEPVEISFSAAFVDRALISILDKKVWPGQTTTTTVTAQALNAEATTYAFEQGSLQVTTPSTGFTKLPIAEVPNADGEFSEDTGVTDVNGVISVALDATSFQVFPPAAITSITVTYDAVGASTLEPGCSDVKTVLLLYEILDPGDLSTVIQTYTFNHVATEEVAFAEGEDFSTVSFSGFGYIIRPAITQV